MSQQTTPPPNTAGLQWQDGQPYSTLYGDVYFSRASGLEETRHVFLQHNQLAERWQSMQANSFTIAETGFGTGLNFLCAWQLWRHQAPDNARLHFVSTEKYPLSRADLAQALALWPELDQLAQALLAQYQQLAPGWHRLVFDQGRVSLTLLIGDLLDTLPALRARVDAWFLDGFSPAKNPDMWQPVLFELMASLSHQHTTFSTFTSAGSVKRGLQAAGFEVGKVAGHGKKREMLCGRFTQGTKPSSLPAGKAIVVGGGIAGTSSSRALADRGWQVTLIEQHAGLAQEASGNPLGVLYPKLARKDVPLGRLSLAGYLYSLRLLQQLEISPDDHARCGMLQLGYDADELERCHAIAARKFPADLLCMVDKGQASKLAGVPLEYEAMFFPEAGWVRPAAFCRALAQHPGIELVTGTRATQLKRAGELWQFWDQDNLLAEAPLVIIANANQAASFFQAAHLPLEPVRGQITQLKQAGISRHLHTLLCTDGYISPSVHGEHCLGATFSPADTGLDIRQADHAQNLAMLQRISPALYEALSVQTPAEGRAALRCTTMDYLPMAGPLLDHQALAIKPPRHTANPATLPWLQGLYVNIGHGSKGLTTAPLAAEMLASAISGEPAPVDAGLLAALDPNRFLLRTLGLKRLVHGLASHPSM
ncbi:bifunctional tRNA (5-methylaminomethyl-2-thiouridine)(34)-methyltransferase MnmD/FAD-dependent 5-carboxymethylaminomethyl-2-thiouridine(34) oxidoreductase MnmC [Methylobacillus caricis]|uniref:bifunctional tRNA (5-methylaminomethyl-2-thiouridine)(34)-methyltransferase MnmD/FAD-dependent 5-carboxymethylaminomethyl-2-thiouridine(34) oxidoreductase MnmC n=1 Tax=Methylobacillus caricis TaxID=1971611 RepID=UPI001CFF7DF3|nr:bifunctional tRNA (5-methylaminomethyl-2-thiouridine)(34)-methyltransferase MnmD/FAD-dependent 5-carboxymethylaminomethyl-2-thiouridine(34) oxidoreductase MnmC [Methylobacillus caricis]MCB5187530.1 bifunctional tRNA (5-methylaminomethyl-2-thiouridine)(34)-methyltransferase MnmD/FAD-dependent 5-carboxymethylaminomethyl-2-thiouridine(34) oxidoreductase MnmC [Methylobacillus caricis]